MGNKRFSQKREKVLCARYGGMRHKNSGSMKVKADFTVGQFKCDVKSTRGQQITVTRKMLKKVDDEAFAVGKDPAIILDFGDQVWWVIPENLINP